MSYIEELAKEIDEANLEFLAQHGYKIEKPYTLEKVLKLKEQLDKDGKVFAYHWEPTPIEEQGGGFKQTLKLSQQIRNKTAEELLEDKRGMAYDSNTQNIR